MRGKKNHREKQAALCREDEGRQSEIQVHAWTGEKKKKEYTRNAGSCRGNGYGRTSQIIYDHSKTTKYYFATYFITAAS